MLVTPFFFCSYHNLNILLYFSPGISDSTNLDLCRKYLIIGDKAFS